MSIKSFSNQFCPACKADTLHYAMKCRQCGHVNLTPSEHRKKCHARRLTQRVVRLKMSPEMALADMHRHDREHAAAKRKESLTWATPRGRGK